MKYNTQLAETKNHLPDAQSILITLPSTAGVDELASGLALFLSLQEAGKNASIATDGIIRVGHSNLFGVGQIQNKLPDTIGGNLIITLGGVVSTDSTGKSVVPALEELNWHPKGADLELMFKVVQGQKFEPTHITPRFEGSGYDLIFTFGNTTLDSLGSIYRGNEEIFKNAEVINVDNKANNSQYGSLNLIDPTASSLSEMTAQVITGLGLPLSSDSATNVLSGIYAASNNLQVNVSPETFETVAYALRAGGQKPTIVLSTSGTQPTATTLEQVFSLQGGSLGGFGTSASSTQDVTISGNNQPENIQPQTPVDLPATQSPAAEQPAEQVQPSPEEVPVEEEVTPEADWLTPKIYKGSSIG